MITRLFGTALVAVLPSLAALPAAAQNQLWIHQFGTSAYEGTSGSATDGVGGVYACGATLGSLGGPNAGYYDAWLARYDSVGNRLWCRQFGGSNADVAPAAASDGAGGVFVGGLTGGFGSAAGSYDAWVARYDSAGNRLWFREFGSSAKDTTVAAAPDGAGGVYLCGITEGSLGGPYLGGGNDAWVAHYDGMGNQLWVRQLATSANDHASSAASDGMGGLYVCGFTSGSLGGPSAGGFDVWLVHYDTAGNQLWIQQFGTSSSDFANSAAPDGAGGFYVTGGSTGSLGGSNAGDYDAWLARYDSAGSQLWIRQIGSNQYDDAYAVAPDGLGVVYIGGHTRGNLGAPNVGDLDVWLARYDSAGNKIWLHQVGTRFDDYTTTATPDGVGGVYVGGRVRIDGPLAVNSDAWIARYDGSCNSGTAYCIASTTSIPGCKAAISAAGTPIMANPTAHTISSGPVPGANLGLLLFGSSGPANTSYGSLGGKLCVKAPTFRTTPKLSGGDQGQCNGSYSFTLLDLINASPIVTSGATIHAEIWARDPANADGFLLSDGLRFTVCP
jgi:hypothetical protein